MNNADAVGGPEPERPPPDACPTLDLAAQSQIMRMLGSRARERWAEVVDAYAMETPRLIASLDGAVGQDDPEEVRRIAHQLKSSSAVLAAVRLARLCEILEHGVVDAVPTDASHQVAAIADEYSRVSAALVQTYGSTGDAAM